ERLPQGHHRAVRHRRGRRSSIKPAALTRNEEAHLNRGIDLAERELPRLPCLVDDELRGIVARIAERERKRADELTSLDRRPRSPSRLRGLSGGNGGVDV